MTLLQTVIDVLEQETKNIQMYRRFETNNRDLKKATGYLAREIKFLRLTDLLKEIQANKNNKNNPFKLNQVMEGLEAELLSCRKNINFDVQNQQTENFASLRDEEKKFGELIKYLDEMEL